MTQRWNPETYARNARFVSDLGMPVLELLAPQAGERVLDLGCGDGALTEKLIEIGCKVVGVDSSPEQVVAARKRGIDAYVAQAQALPFEGEFDAVLSNAVLHWVKDADGAIASVRRALVAGGRFAAELGGYGCVDKIRSAMHAALRARGVDPAPLDPWYFPSDVEYRGRLERGGFDVRSIALFDRPTPLPGDVSGWLETFTLPFLSGVAPADRAELIDDVRERLRPALCDAEGRWTADYVRLRVLAIKA